MELWPVRPPSFIETITPSRETAIVTASGGTVSSVRSAASNLDAQWSFGEPRPTLYYDPRTAEEGAKLSLHATCVVVDRRYSLITSANFTARAQTRNIEVGL